MELNGTGALRAGQFRSHQTLGDDDMAAMSGTIKRLVSDKGFGFVAAQDGSEYFFHQSACAETRFDDLREGQAVTFEKGQGPKGPRAEYVKLA
jgi:cold shock protein